MQAKQERQPIVQQNLLNDGLSFLFGLHDLNSEFYVTEASGLFLNSSFGVGPELSHSGKAGPSLFPTTALGLRARAVLNDQWSIQTAVYDGVPGNPDDPRGTHIILRADEGVMSISEVAWGGFHLGGWIYSSPQ